MNLQPFPIVPHSVFGDYQVKVRISSDIDREVWLAEQVSQNRQVEVVCYTGDSPSEFLADAHIKMAVKDAIYGEVYETIETGDLVGLARELLPGKNLIDLANQGHQFQPVEICDILAKIGEPLEFMETHGIPRAGLSAEDVRLDHENNVRIRNVAAAENRRSIREAREKLAGVLQQLLMSGLPGSTRVQTLLEMMVGTPLKGPLPWKEIHRAAAQIHRELSSPEVGPAVARPYGATRERGNKVFLAAALLIAFGAGVVTFFVTFNDSWSSQTSAILIPAGRYATPEGEVIARSGFRIDATEVTIGDYAEFLGSWGRLSKRERAELLPSDIFDDNWDMRPADWTDYYPLARENKKWQGERLTLDHPVVGVDWWDATAYAIWKGGRLPTYQDWWAAASTHAEKGHESDHWKAVGGSGKGPHQLIGNVAEWARERSRDPAKPDEPPRFSILGSSFQSEKKSAFVREWVDSPEVTRRDLGFRVVYDET